MYVIKLIADISVAFLEHILLVLYIEYSRLILACPYYERARIFKLVISPKNLRFWDALPILKTTLFCDSAVLSYNYTSDFIEGYGLLTMIASKI